MNNQISVILLAGGQGTRIGLDDPKQFIRVAGKPVLLHTYEALRTQLPKAMIVVVAPVDAIEQVANMLGNEENTMIVPGGASRQLSTYEGMKALRAFKPLNVLIHDAARPFVSGQIIHDVVTALKRHEAVDVAIPTSDTIIVERNGFIQNIPERKHILRGQTPQGFRYEELMASYEYIGEDGLEKFTDDCGIYLNSNPMGKIRIVQGSEENFKITNPVDLILADEMFRLRLSECNIDRPGVDIKGKRIIIFGGTSGIGKAMKDIMSDAGANVIICGRRNGCDIQNPASVKKTLDEAATHMGGIDIVINAAGFLLKKQIKETEDSDIELQIATNLTGALWVAKYSYEHLKKSKGSLLQFASSSYTRGRANSVIYSATKAAIVNMTQGLSEEWIKDEIRVHCIVPGRTDTNMRRTNFENESPQTLHNPYEVALTATKIIATHNTGYIQRII
jgi:2-C-methyl-D-erythritol 4-phosphate cytidylyltransferase